VDESGVFTCRCHSTMVRHAHMNHLRDEKQARWQPKLRDKFSPHRHDHRQHSDRFSDLYTYMLCSLPGCVACMCERHVTHTKVVEDPEYSQTVADTVASFYTDQRRYSILFMCLDYL
jgi:hypothetical protein